MYYYIYGFIPPTALYLVLNYPTLLQWPSAGVSGPYIGYAAAGQLIFPIPVKPFFAIGRSVGRIKGLGVCRKEKWKLDRVLAFIE